MDTKWRSRLLIFGWLFLFAFGISGVLIGVFEGHRYLENDYFQTERFNDEYTYFNDLLETYELDWIPKEEAIKSVTASKKEIEEYRNQFGTVEVISIKGQYKSMINEAKAGGNQKLADLHSKERDQKIEDIIKNFNSDEYIEAKVKEEKKEVIENYYKDLESRQGEFENYKNAYSYFLKNIKTGEIYTNTNYKSESDFAEYGLLNIQKYSNESSYISTDGSYIDDGMTYEINLTDSGLFEGVIGVKEDASSVVMGQYKDYKKELYVFWIYVVLGLLSLGISIYLYKRKGMLQRFKEVNSWEVYYNKLPFDVKIILFLTTIIGFFATLNTISYSFYNVGGAYNYIYDFFFFTVLITLFLSTSIIQGQYLRATYKDISSISVEWKGSLLKKGFEIIKEAFLIRKLGTQLTIFSLLVFWLGGVTAATLVSQELIILFLGTAIIVLPIIFIMIKQLSLFNRIMLSTEEIASGKLGPDLPAKGKSILAKHADHINLLKHGVKTSQIELVKSDRLKTELVTNISHDLRTPLTSIISYTDLLKNPELVEEDRQAYIEIIDKKAGRLKVLIEDLFEVSKMVSGNIELDKKEIDVVQLLQQSLAELNDTIKSSGLEFRVQKPDTPVIAKVDGQKIWRVFDNLLGNILKYSLEGTRVYIVLKETANEVMIIFKNVTKFELSENVDELFERFKRGDTSRHTDGSGLGLAIGKSIVEIHGGLMEIEVDGDLFKVTVKIPK